MNRTTMKILTRDTYAQLVPRVAITHYCPIMRLSATRAATINSPPQNLPYLSYTISQSSARSHHMPPQVRVKKLGPSQSNPSYAGLLTMFPLSLTGGLEEWNMTLFRKYLKTTNHTAPSASTHL